MPKPTIGALQDELKARDKRIAELRDELDEARDLIRRMEEQVEDARSLIERWCEAFDMQLGDDGNWSANPWIERAVQLGEQYDAIVRDWNRFAPQYNAAVVPHQRNVGRPLAASEAQREQVLKLRRAGRSLRAIAEKTNLTLRTVCTVVGKSEGTDRTSIKHLRRIDPDRAQVLRRKSQARAIRGLPKAISAALEAGRDLLKEAKGQK